MAKKNKISFPNLRPLTTAVALAYLIQFRLVSGIEVGSTFSEKLSGTVDDSIIQMNLHCIYKTYSPEIYVCILHDLDVRIKNIEVTSFTGSHDVGKTDDDVDGIYFFNSTMFSLPNGIGKNFYNLSVFVVERGLNTKFIKRSNFRNLDNLKFVTVEQNEIEILPFDTLWDLPDLKQFCFRDNNINVLDERTFKNTRKLTRVNLERNRLEFLPENLFKNNEKLTYLTVERNRLEFLPRDLFKNNVLLKHVNFNRNSLKNIQVDFTSLKHLEYVFMSGNTCIDASYSGHFTEFQSKITVDCSSTN